MATFTFCPAFGASEKVTPRVLTAQFGDGYQQRIGDGINIAPRTWSLNFSRKQSDIALIRAFLQARNGIESFDWTPPRGLAGKFICPEWNTSVMNGADQVSLSFIEVFE